MKYIGLNKLEVEESRSQYGSNVLTELAKESLWLKLLHGFQDPMIMILLVALAIQTVLFFLGQAEWYEPFGVFVAIMIANGVAAVSESKQEGKAKSLKEDELSKQMVKVIRDGILQQLHITELVVGDVVFLQPGDKLPVDGEVLDGQFKVDQATLNGETEEADKLPNPSHSNYNIKDLLNKHYMYRGTVICSGEGYLETKVVGDKTLFGQLALEVQEETRQTPLQIKLAKLADQISAFGYFGAVLIVLGILFKTLLVGPVPSGLWSWVRLIIDAVTVAVTVIVCAVPEGLPMLTSILMSLQSLKMAKDNVLVHKIKGIETAGSLSILFSDKTGTITEGKLSVAEFCTGNVQLFSELESISEPLRKDITIGIGSNNSATASNGEIIGGNSTDRALLDYLVKNMSGSYTKEELYSFDPFNSVKKSASIVLKLGQAKTTYIKGAPEILLEHCSSYMDIEGNIHKLTERNYLLSYLDAQAARSMRLIAVAKAPGENPAEDWTLICIASIRDNVRLEAARAIDEVKKAGIQVVMVTGDRKETAAAIAREAGLITAKDNIVLTSAEMQELSDAELKAILPKLRVVARALPTDKSRLVRIAQELNLVVGMTGDGVNDSPALKKADVGFAMGSGTEVAKEAGDITILDDNFSSIEKAILYGRTMFKSIRKFLIFQLTVNVAAVAVCFIGPLLGENIVLTVIQLLLINLAMDTLAAMAYGAEPALQEFMQDKPIARDASIITKSMYLEVICSATYITLVCLGILFWEPLRKLFCTTDVIYLKSAVFATFMMAITFNGFNARTSHINVLKNIGLNLQFLVIMGLIFTIQFVFVTFGGDFLSVKPLAPSHWLLCGFLALLVIPLDILRKLLCK